MSKRKGMLLSKRKANSSDSLFERAGTEETLTLYELERGFLLLKDGELGIHQEMKAAILLRSAL